MHDTLVGNEVKVKRFTNTQWTLFDCEGSLPVVESPDGTAALEVVKRFEFDHHRMSISVAMKHRATGALYVFCKGSYEKMQQVSTPSSVPENYATYAQGLAKQGCYVLGVACKQVDASGMPDAQCTALLDDRDAIEAGLSLLGLITFRNELKPDSRAAIAILKRGDVRTVVITGDNAMTGCYIACASGMVATTAKVILGEMVETTLVWKAGLLKNK